MVDEIKFAGMLKCCDKSFVTLDFVDSYSNTTNRIGVHEIY